MITIYQIFLKKSLLGMPKIGTELEALPKLMPSFSYWCCSCLGVSSHINLNIPHGLLSPVSIVSFMGTSND